MKLTDKQKSKIRQSIAAYLAASLTDGWGEPLKDVDQEKTWPTLDDDASDEDMEALSDACFDYLDTATRAVVKQLKEIR
jgi:hypothetical protein